jgi:hypothetical protein
VDGATDHELGGPTQGHQIIELESARFDPNAVEKGPVAAIEVFNGDDIRLPNDPRVVARDLRIIDTEFARLIPADDDGLIVLERTD